MKTKHTTVITLAMFGTIMVLSGCAPRPEEPEAQKGAATPAAEITARVFTDNDFIEYMAQTSYLTAKHEKNPIKLGEKLNKLHEKYPGIDEKFSIWITKWSQKAINNPENAGKQLEEMMEKVKNRVNELKKGR